MKNVHYLLGSKNCKWKVTLIPVGKSLSGVLYRVKKNVRLTWTPVIFLDPQNCKQKITLIPIGKSLSGVLHKVKKNARLTRTPHSSVCL